MATQQEQPPKSPAVLKYDSFVERQLARASGRVRKLDLAAAGLLFLIGTLLYGVSVIVADLYLELSSEVRLAAFLTFAGAALAYAVSAAVYFARRRVNPYYAARQLEKTLQDAKGSVVNWLDLRDQPLPQAIRGALGARAAKDLSHADVDEAISGRRALWLGGVAAVLAVAAFVLFLTGPSRFGSLLGRAFAPFKEMKLATRTELVLVEPEAGDATVPLNQKVQFRVRVHGRVPRLNQPDSLKLLYRYNQADAYLEQPLERDPEGDWAATVLADQVQNGFWYKVAGGDAETPEYRVRVRPIPQVARFDVKYHYRPYHRRADRVEHYPNDAAVFPHLKDFRGTEVTLTARANRVLRQGHLEMDLGGAKQTLPGKAPADDPEALQFRFVLERPGSFRVHFTSQEGEANADRSPYRIDVIEDRTPLVELHRPGADVKLPANGTLLLEGSATDDLGVKSMTLRMKVVQGPSQGELEPKAYREGKSFLLANGKYPDRLEYKDFVALESLKSAKKASLPLAAGTKIEYWLEAVDNSDHPDPSGNLGQSKHYSVTVTDPEKDARKQQQERDQARTERQRHEQNQDREFARQNEQAAQEKAEQDAARQDPGQAEKRQKEFEDQVRDTEKKLQEKGQQQDPRGEAKGAEPAPKGESKEQGPGDSGSGKDEQKQPGGAAGASDKKEAGSKGQGADKNQAKDDGKGGDPKEEQGQGAAKEGGQQGQSPAEAKGGKEGASGQDNKAAAKDQKASQPQPGAGKDEGAGGDKADAGKAKADNGSAGGQQARAEQKQGGNDGGGKAEAKGDPAQAAGGGEPQGRSEKKDGPQDLPGQARAQQPGGGEKAEAARRKDGRSDTSPSRAKGDEPAGARGGEKKGGGQQASAPKDGKGPGGKGADAAERKGQPDPSRQPGLAKTAGKSDPQQTDGNAREKEPTAEDVARLKDQARRGTPQARKEARDELSRLGREAKDQGVRDAAKEALQEPPGKLGGANESPGETANGDPRGEGPPNKGGQTPESGDPKSGSNKGNGSTAQGNKEPGKVPPGTRGQRPDGTDGTSQGGLEEPAQASKADPNFARRGGNLQLENLKQKLTPELLKELHPEWTEQQRQQFLHDLRAAARRRQEKQAGNDKLGRPGSTPGLLPGASPYQVGAGANQLNGPLDSGHFQPPPEFRDAYRRFTTPGGGGQGTGNKE